MSRRLFFRASLCAGLAAVCPSLLRAQSAPLRMAVHPYNSTLALIAAHRPLLQHLENTLQHPIEFYTASSFDAYVAALMAGEYDIAISPPHFALIAIETGHYVPLVHYRAKLEPLLLVPRASPIQGPADFAGKRIAMADKSAFIRLVVIKWLADAGLVAGKGYGIVERPTHSASIMATLRGEADAGLAVAAALNLQPPDVRKLVRPVATGLKFPNLFTLAHRRLGAASIARLKAALQGFTSTHPEGRVFFEKTGYGGYDEITPGELTALKPYVELTRPLVPARPILSTP